MSVYFIDPLNWKLCSGGPAVSILKALGMRLVQTGVWKPPTKVVELLTWFALLNNLCGRCC